MFIAHGHTIRLTLPRNICATTSSETRDRNINPLTKLTLFGADSRYFMTIDIWLWLLETSSFSLLDFFFDLFDFFVRGVSVGSVIADAGFVSLCAAFSRSIRRSSAR
jgi:hypothetical protein